MRHLLVFFALGAALLAGKSALERTWSAAQRPRLAVHVKALASTADRERAIDEAVLVEEALRAGGARIDPVVREQLLVSMRATVRSHAEEPRASTLRSQSELPRATEGSESDGQLLERAIALGLHRADPVTRQRLAFQAEQLLTARVAVEQPSDAELSTYVRAHKQRYALPPRFSFVQVLLSPTRHGVRLADDVQTLLSRLRRDAVAADTAAALGDPTLLPHTFQATDAVTLDAQLGAGFSAAVLRGELGVWSGPVQSSYGQHLVLLQGRVEGRVPALSELRERALADYRHDRRRELLRERLRTLRSHYRVELRSSRS